MSWYLSVSFNTTETVKVKKLSESEHQIYHFFSVMTSKQFGVLIVYEQIKIILRSLQ